MDDVHTHDRDEHRAFPCVRGRVQDMADDPCGGLLRLQARARDGVKAELSAVSAVSAAAGTVPELQHPSLPDVRGAVSAVCLRPDM